MHRFNLTRHLLHAIEATLNDNTVERGLFYQAVHTVLEITLDEEMALEDYIVNLRRMKIQITRFMALSGKAS